VDARPDRVSRIRRFAAVNRVIEGEHQVNDHATVSYEYENGVRGTLQLCMFALDFPSEDLGNGEIIGDAGMLVTRISANRNSANGSAEQIKGTQSSTKCMPAAEKDGEITLGFDEIHERICKLHFRKQTASHQA